MTALTQPLWASAVEVEAKVLLLCSRPAGITSGPWRNALSQPRHASYGVSGDEVR
jgi:hypothetical protein